MNETKLNCEGHATDKKMIAIICAMDSEIRDMIAALENETVEHAYGYDFYLGVLNGTDVVLVRCGVGKVNAARGTQMLIDRYAPAAIINSGIAGGIAKDLQIGDIVIGTDFVQHDFDISLFGYAKGYMSTGTEPDKPTVFHADKALVEKLSAAAESAITKYESGDRRVHQGRIASGDQFIATSESKQMIAEIFGATAAEMEGAAIAQTAEYAGVPFAVLRVISDLADGKSPSSYEKFELESSLVSEEIMFEFLKQL